MCKGVMFMIYKHTQQCNKWSKDLNVFFKDNTKISYRYIISYQRYADENDPIMMRIACIKEIWKFWKGLWGKRNYITGGNVNRCCFYVKKSLRIKNVGGMMASLW